MKRNVLIAVALVATMTAAAQNIAVVSPSNETDIYQTLDEAITNAEGGSTIYLPAGGHQISDATLIDKRLTIMGVSHRADTDNAEGATIIGGNLHFVEGSSYSAVLGVYISGEVFIGDEGAPVNYVSIRKCNLLNLNVKNSLCIGTEVNQNYIRRRSLFGYSDAIITNNITEKIFNLGSGTISNNVVMDRDGYYYAFADPGHAFDHVNNTTITNNIILTTRVHRGSNSEGAYNLVVGGSWGNYPHEIDANAETLFVKDKGVSISSDYHFNKDYKEYEDEVGIYAGSGFDPDALAPIPRIISKKVDEQSDANGKLTINVTVKAQ